MAAAGGDAMTEIRTAAQAMLAENLKWLEVAATLDGSRELQRTLIDAESADAPGLAAVIRLISLAHIAHSISEQDAAGAFVVWYRDIGQRLLCRAVDAAAAL